ncbi:MAG TPA: RNA 2',3'-cyclic phosphodiesterase [Ignavibacteriaceae bacterium]|nr:RNA 2',3'-cyclic phosphodiesterase [Ignavibacteriaceae bacterium]
MTRLFIALEIPKEIRQKISELKEEAVPDSGDLKWEPTEKIHLTIKFIGDVKDELVNPIIDSMVFLGQYEKIKCRLTKFGFFSKHGIPQILWIGLWVDSILYNILEQLNSNLVKFGVSVEERKFKPHVTLLRIKKRFPEKWVTDFNSFIIPEIDFISDNIMLIKSELLPESSKYTVLKKFNLK